MVHIALINPFVPKANFDDHYSQLPPLGLLYIAAVLEREGHTVTVIDAELFCLAAEEAADALPPGVELVGIGGTTLQAGEAYKLATVLKARFPASRVVYGGPHACAVTHAAFDECPALDYVILGPGEAPFAALAAGDAPGSIPGCLIKGGPAVPNPAFAEPLSYADMPLPARHLVPIKCYAGAGRLPFIQTSMMITRGCPFNCMFCSSTVWGKSWDERAVADILDELRVIKDLGFSEVFFQDDTINVDVRWAKALFTAINEAGLGLKYKLQLRVNEKMLPEDLIARMAEAGVEHVFFGVESANDVIRETVAKGISKDEVRRAVALAKKYHIDTTLAFIIGLPGETEATVEESIQFVKELQPWEAGFSIAKPFPGSRLRQWAVDSGCLMNANYEALATEGSVMRTEALSCAGLMALRHKAEHETVRFTSRSAVSAEALCDHLIAKLLPLQLEDEHGLETRFIALVLCRVALDVQYGHELCIWLTQKMLAAHLSKYSIAKVHALFAYSLAVFGNHEAATEYFFLVEEANIPEITAWCKEKYVTLGYDGLYLATAPLPGTTIPENLPPLVAGMLAAFPSSTLHRYGIPADKETAIRAHSEHAALVGSWPLLASALRAEGPQKRQQLIWANGLLSSLRTEGEMFDTLKTLREVSGADTVLIAHDVFGSARGDTFRSRPKLASYVRAVELAAMAGWEQSLSSDGFLFALHCILLGEPLLSRQWLVLRPAMTDLNRRRHLVAHHANAREAIEALRGHAAEEIGDELAKLVVDDRFDLLLRHELASALGLEDELYKESRKVNYTTLGQWHHDYARMVAGAIPVKGRRLLDIGCAYGAHVLAYRLGGIDAYGVDVNVAFLDAALPYAKHFLRHTPADNPQSLLDIFGNRTFDGIVLTEVWEHIPLAVKKAYLPVLAKLLRPGGKCVITCPVGDQDFENIYGGGMLADPQHQFLIPEKQLRKNFTDHGFEDVSEEYRAHMRAFRGKYGFSFWRTYLAFDKHFCFKVPGDLPATGPASHLRAMLIAKMAWLSYYYLKDRYSLRTIKKCIKCGARFINDCAVRVLPTDFKEKLKTTAWGQRVRAYLRRG